MIALLCVSFTCLVQASSQAKKYTFTQAVEQTNEGLRFILRMKNAKKGFFYEEKYTPTGFVSENDRIKAIQLDHQQCKATPCFHSGGSEKRKSKLNRMLQGAKQKYMSPEYLPSGYAKDVSVISINVKVEASFNRVELPSEVQKGCLG